MENQTASLQQPLYLKVPAKIVSYIFHPLFIPNLYFFMAGNGASPFSLQALHHLIYLQKKLSVILNTAFFPAFSVFLLWRLKFVNSILLKTQKERIIPYVITMIFYWWMWVSDAHLNGSTFCFKILLFRNISYQPLRD